MTTLFATYPAYTGLGIFRRHDEEQRDMRDWRYSMRGRWG